MPVIGARPEPVEFDVAASALIVVDMQNGYCSPGGYFDLAGFEIGQCPKIIEAVDRLVARCRGAGIRIVWLQNGWDTSLKEAGAPGSVNQLKGNALKLMRARPELTGELLTKGGWDYAIVDRLTPQNEDIIISKTRYSGFAGTPLDSLLRSNRISHLLVCGVATNVCVESTIRDAFFLEFFPILITDSCLQAGPAMLQEATIYNVERFFGWTTTAADLGRALRGEEPALDAV